MEFKVSSQELLKGISDVSKAIPSKSALAILENFLFVLNGNILEIDHREAKLNGSVSSGSILIDGLGVGDIGYNRPKSLPYPTENPFA